MTKRCPRCGETKPFDQYGKRKASPDGLQSTCKTCINTAAEKARDGKRGQLAAAERERRKKPEIKAAAAARRERPEEREKARQRTAVWREDNLEQDRQTSRNWAAAHPEENRERAATWRTANPGRVVQQQADHYQRNSDRKKTASAQYRAEHDEELIAHRRQRRIDHPEHVRAIERASNSLRRARKAGAATHPFTREQVGAKVKYWGEKCWVCGGGWDDIDHVKPLAKGGAHMICNFRPICRRCNSGKSARWPLPKGLQPAREYLLRWLQLLDSNRQVR